MAPALVHLGTDQTQHAEKPHILITMGECHRRHPADTNYQYSWTGDNQQKIDWHRVDL